jgi:hypothetical protein
MDEIISYKMCAAKVRNAKLRNYLKQYFSLSCVSVHTNRSYPKFPCADDLVFSRIH